MSTILNNFTKYNFTIRILIQIIYDFRTREAFDLLRIKNLDLIISKAKTVTITIYPILIKNAIKNDAPTSRRRIPSPKMIISTMSPTSRQTITPTKTISSDKKLISQPSFVTKTSFNETPEVFVMSPTSR